MAIAIDGYEEHIRRTFKHLARTYDIVMRVFAGTRRRVVAVTAPPPGSRLLDVATGTGQQALAFAEAGCDVTGVYLSSDMIRVARGKNSKYDVKFLVGNAEELPFADDEFDVAVISAGLHDMPQDMRVRAIREMKRVTRSGGAVVGVDYSLRDDNLIRKIISSYIKLMEKSPYNDFTTFDLVSTFADAGIEQVQIVPVLYRTVDIVKGSNNK